MQLSVSVSPITEAVSLNTTFIVPSTYYGTFNGDLDDGSNSLKRWFWEYKVVRPLHDNTNEPWAEICFGGVPQPWTGEQPQSEYDAVAASGIEAVKMDWGWYGKTGDPKKKEDWQFSPKEYPHGFNFGIRAHAAGMNASLYMGGTYLDCDMNKIQCRDTELEQIRMRFDATWMDQWRTDTYTAPENPMPDTFIGISNFYYILDTMLATRPGFRYENCANGGRYKGFSTARRFMYMTANDADSDSGTDYRATVWNAGHALNPIQLKSDVQVKNFPVDFMIRTSMIGAMMLCGVNSSDPVYREHVALYKSKQRPILRGGNMYHILPKPDGTNWDGFEFFHPGLQAGSVFLFKPSARAVDGSSKRIFLKGLRRSDSYKLTFQSRTAQSTTMSGADLMLAGLNVTGLEGDHASELIWIN